MCGICGCVTGREANVVLMTYWGGCATLNIAGMTCGVSQPQKTFEDLSQWNNFKRHKAAR
jgi:hypothetical protein